MWKVPQPDITKVREQLLLSLGAEWNKDEIDKLCELYDKYVATFGRPSPALRGPSMSEDFLEALRHAYSQVQSNGRLSKLRDALKLGAHECPYCGFGEIQDLDHHLPKAVYKAFSIFPVNLVPCCTTCNRGKGKKPNSEPTKHLLNVYLEDPTGVEFLYCEVSLVPATGALVTSFEIRKSAGMDDEMFARLQHHLHEFNLNDRYPAQVNIYLGEQETALESLFKAGGSEQIRQFLTQSASKTAKRFGLNNWRTAVLKGLARCQDFCAGGFVSALGQARDKVA